MPYTTIDEIEQDKASAIGVYASSTASVRAVRALIKANPQSTLFLAMLDDGPPLGDPARQRPDLADRIIKAVPWRECEWPENLQELARDKDVDRAFLASVSSLIWFVDTAAVPPPVGSGAYYCMLSVLLGEQIGLPITFRNAHGRTIASPLTDDMRRFAQQHLDKREAERMAHTAIFQSEGLWFAPGFAEPALWSSDGCAVYAGMVSISIELAWRIRRVERWINSYIPWCTIPDSVWDLIDQEEEACKAGLRDELGQDVIRE